STVVTVNRPGLRSGEPPATPGTTGNPAPAFPAAPPGLRAGSGQARGSRIVPAPGVVNYSARRTLGFMALCNTAPRSRTIEVRVGAAGATLAAPPATPEAVEATEILEAEDRPWATEVWDDPANLMHDVAYIFQKLSGYSKAKATTRLLNVHTERTPA